MTGYRIIGRTSHPARGGQFVIVDAEGKRCHYAKTRQAAQRWIGSTTGVATRQAKAKKGKGEVA